MHYRLRASDTHLDSAPRWRSRGRAVRRRGREPAFRLISQESCMPLGEDDGGACRKASPRLVTAKNLFHRPTARSHMSQTAIHYLLPERRVHHAASLDENGNEATSGAMWSPDHKWSLLRLADLRGQAAASPLAVLTSKSGKQTMRAPMLRVRSVARPCPSAWQMNRPSLRCVTEYGQPARPHDSDNGSIERAVGLKYRRRPVRHRSSPHAEPPWESTLDRKPRGRS